MIGSLLRLQLTALTSLLLGLAYALTDERRYSGPAFDGVRQLASIRVWGWTLVVLSLLLWACLHYRRHPALVAGAAVLVTGWYGAGLAALLTTALDDTRVSYGGAILYGFLAALHASVAYASMTDALSKDR